VALSIEQRLAWLAARTEELAVWLVRDRVDLDGWRFDGAPLALGAPWPARNGVGRLEHGEVRLPPDWPAQDARLELDLGGEGLLTLRGADGTRTQFGLDEEHRAFPVPAQPFAVEVEIVARLAFGAPHPDPRLARARLALIDLPLERLVRRLDLLALAASELPDHDAAEGLVRAGERAVRALRLPSATRAYLSRVRHTPAMRLVWELPQGLDDAPPALGADERASVAEAHGILDAELAALRERFPPAGALLLTGHAHLDLAWRWPLAETRRKARRTLSTAVELLRTHPELTFNQSSAQVYAFLEEDDPTLLERVGELVAEGRLEPIGGMWVEPDCVMPAGESLVRQLLYGQRAFRARFGAEHTVCWLPDCFGFTPALPQLLRGAGIERFFTSKLSWSETNRFPHDLFWWEGLDGSRVLAHLFDNPDGGYNGVVGPVAALATWRNDRAKALHPESLLSVGYGDGGGGLTREMVERARELASFPALPAQRFGRVDGFFDRAKRSVAENGAPTWVGELYLELHRGTLTSQGRTKRAHRRAERDLVAAEALGALVALAGGELPASLEPQWHVLLRNEFHDILPGSSIREVAEEAEAELGAVTAAAGEEIAARLDELAGRLADGGGEALLAVNPDLSTRPLRAHLPWAFPGSQPVAGGGAVVSSARPVAGLEAVVVREAPPAGALSARPDGLENDLVRVEIAADGTLASVWDKRAEREVLAGRGNQVWAYVDKPREWDAWDVDAGYAREGTELVASGPPEVVEVGPHRAAVRVQRRLRDSAIVQDVRLWAGSARVELATRLDWHDRRWLLKARFPLAVRAPHATFETAFGVVQRPTHRNTSWDQARFEVAGHRFADLSEPGYGVALLNDGRYGHHALGSELGLSLLRSPAWPDPLADEGVQELVYALYPHAGSWLEGGVLAEAEDLNRPLLVRPVAAGREATVRPLALGGPALALGALKPLEDGGGLLLRVYEPQGARGTATLALPEGWELDAETDLLERPTGPPDLRFAPFQVRTHRLVRR
jgi:alpha-mannosidase